MNDRKPLDLTACLCIVLLCSLWGGQQVLFKLTIHDIHPNMQIAFNPEFLQAPLRALDTENVYLDLIDEMSPGVLRIEGSFLYVLMPMRVTN